MAERKKIRDTKLGKWLKEKAPDVLDTVGTCCQQCGLGVVKTAWW